MNNTEWMPIVGPYQTRKKAEMERRGSGLLLCVLLFGIVGCDKKSPETVTEKTALSNSDTPVRKSLSEKPATEGSAPHEIEGAPAEKIRPPAPPKENETPKTSGDKKVESGPPSTEIQRAVAEIKRTVAEINSNIKKYETDTNTFDEGGEVPVTLFYEGRSLRKVLIDARGSFDMRWYSVEGFFKDDKLVFVFYKETTAENPNMETGTAEAWHHTHRRVYVHDGMIVRYLRKQERQQPEAASRIKHMANTPVRDPAAILEITEQINEWFGAAFMVSLFGNRGYPCCLQLIDLRTTAARQELLPG